jgi:two-component system sensor histidine kinase BaeS
MTLQQRVLGYLALAAIASCVLTVAVGALLVRGKISSQRLSTLTSQAAAIAAVGGAPRSLTPGQHVYSVQSGRTRRLGRLRTRAVIAAIGPGDAQGHVTVAGVHLIYAARETAAGRVVLVAPAAIAFSEWRPFLGSLAIAGVGAALLALLLSYALARRLVRPIRSLSEATRRLASGEPEVLVPIAGEDELAALGMAFNEMSGELTRARESQRHFLESVSHELKTPLTSIRGYAEALEESAVTPADAARVISAESIRLGRLVSDLLELARFGRADFAVSHEPLDLTEIAAHVTSRHLPRARELNVELRSVSSDDATAIGDADRLLQAVSNLVENALRLTPAGGNVVISVSPGVVAVRDTGPGLAEEDLPRAFDGFYLHNRYRSERAVGSGLGLAIVRDLVDAMGGSVSAGNAAGGGAEFVVRLPSASERR